MASKVRAQVSAASPSGIGWSVEPPRIVDARTFASKAAAARFAGVSKADIKRGSMIDGAFVIPERVTPRTIRLHGVVTTGRGTRDSYVLSREELAFVLSASKADALADRFPLDGTAPVGKADANAVNALASYLADPTRVLTFAAAERASATGADAL